MHRLKLPPAQEIEARLRWPAGTVHVVDETPLEVLVRASGRNAWRFQAWHELRGAVLADGRRVVPT